MADIVGVLAERHDDEPQAILVVCTDDAGTIAYANPAAAQLLDCTVADLVGLPIEQLIPERFHSRHRRLRADLAEEPRTTQRRASRVVLGLIGGEERMVIVDVDPIDDLPGHVLASMRPLESWVDTTSWTVNAFEHSPTPIALVELAEGGDRIIRAANPALAELLGYPVAELLGMGFDQLTFAEDEADDRTAAAAMAAGAVDRYVRRKRYRHRDGHALWCELSSRLLPGEDSPALALAHLIDLSAEVELAELHRDIEARLRSEVEARTKALAESERLLRQSLAAASMACWIYDVAEDRFELVADDHSWPGLRSGRTAAGVLAFVHPDDVGPLTEAVRAVAGPKRSFDVTVRTRDGLTRRWVRVAGDAVEGTDGASGRVIGVVHDATPIQSLIDDLRRSERQLSLSVKAAGLGTWVTDLAKHESRLDETTRAIFRLGGDEVINAETIQARVHPDDVDRLSAALDRVAIDGTQLATVFRLADADGIRWVQCWSEPIIGNSGRIEGTVGVLQDITAERSLVAAAQTGEQKLREREDRLRLVLAATTSGTWDWDLEAETIEFSPEFLQHLGYEDTLSGDAPGAWDRLTHPDEWAMIQELLLEHAQGQTAFAECVHRLRAGDGSWRWFRTRGRAVERDRSGRALRIIGAAMDITDQKRMETQLLHGAKMQALGALAGSVAHDFNNVMAIVRGHVELLRQPLSGAPPDPDETERRLAAIEQSVDRASSFVRQLMALGRPEENRPANIDLGAFVLDIAPTLAQFVGPDITLEVDVPGDEFSVSIDAGRLEALLLNLAANARDAMASGGRLAITVRERRTDGASGPTAVLEVTDTGIGMDAETAAAAFEPFFTTKAPGVGAGLGLAGAMAAVSAAGGAIDIDSAIGAGTTMTVTLPLTTGSTQVPHPAMPPRASTRSGTVLLVEDEAELLELTADAVRARGLRVHTALSGFEAIAILESEAIDLVVTDAVMPGMSGAELAETVAQRWPDLPIVFVTGHAPGDRAVPTTSKHETLAKPVPMSVLLEAIESKLPELPSDPEPG